MTMTIKFPTLEKEVICIDYEDAVLIGSESHTVALILAREIKEEDYSQPRFGGKAIEFAIEYCKYMGRIETNKEADAEAWVDHFIGRVTKDGLGMVHELLAVSDFLSAFRLIDIICQYIFDHLPFNHYGVFCKIFGISSIFPPYAGEVNVHHLFEDILQLPTLEDIHEKFNVEFPFTPEEFNSAEIENKSIRFGGNLEYDNENGLVKEILIKTEYLVRRLISLGNLTRWMEDTYSESVTNHAYLSKTFSSNKSNYDIDKLYSTFGDNATRFFLDIMCFKGIAMKESAYLCTSHQIYTVLYLVREWSSREVIQGYIKRLKDLKKQNLDDTWDQDEDEYVDVENEGLVSPRSVADDKNMDVVVSSLISLQDLSEYVLAPLDHIYNCYRSLLRVTREIAHFNLLLKDEEILTFICNEKLKIYQSSFERRRTRKIRYAEEFDRIKNETNRKFGQRDLAIEEAKKEYFVHFEKCWKAMDAETACLEKLQLEFGLRRQKQKKIVNVPLKYGLRRQKRKKTINLMRFTNILNVHD